MKRNKGFSFAVICAAFLLAIWSPFQGPENGKSGRGAALKVCAADWQQPVSVPQSEEALGRQLGQLMGVPQSEEALGQQSGQPVSVPQSEESPGQLMGVPQSEEALGQQSGQPAGVQQPDQILDQMAEQALEGLDLKEKAAQLFIVLPEQLTGSGQVTEAGESTRNAINQLPVGGLIYMEQNLISEDQIIRMISGVQQYSQERTGLPAFICVDEEGGTVSRINGRGIVDASYIGNMSEVGQSGDKSRAYQIGAEMGGYLSRLGFNVDFAPVADVLSNPANSVVKYRSFGSDVQVVTRMVTAELEGLRSAGVYGTLKHFPGHGATEGDTHEGYAYSSKTLEEMRYCELIPFQEGIIQGVDFIMAGHISLPNVTGNNTPASLSYEITTGILREEMGFKGIIVTDALNMGAVSQIYSSAEAAVRAIKAGADLILMPSDLQSAYDGILDAVERGELTEERIDESVRRILKVKMKIKAEMA